MLSVADCALAPRLFSSPCAAPGGEAEGCGWAQGHGISRARQGRGVRGPAPCPGDARRCQGWGAWGEAGKAARAGAPPGAPGDREGLPGVRLHPSACPGWGSAARPPHAATVGAHVSLRYQPRAGAPPGRWLPYVHTHPPRALHTKASGCRNTHPTSMPLHARVPRSLSTGHHGEGSRAHTRGALGMQPCINPRAFNRPPTPCMHPAMQPPATSCPAQGLPKRRPCRQHCPLTLHGIAEAVALRGLGSRLPGKP